MSDATTFPAGGYRYIPAVFQYSAGVAADPGFELVRVRWRRALPLAEAFSAVEAHLRSVGRPTTAFAQCELRSPDAFTDQGFIEFNRHYVTTLERWSLFKNDVNPVARTNVCPLYDKPATPAMVGFTYTVPAAASARPTFVLSGGGDARGGAAHYKDRIVRYGETSLDAMREKVDFVVGEMARRLTLLGFSWADAVCTRAYTVRDIGPLVDTQLAQRGVIAQGLTWIYAKPPVIGLEYEMDVLGHARETVL